MTIEVSLNFCWLKSWHILVAIVMLGNLIFVLAMMNTLENMAELEEMDQNKMIQWGCINPPPAKCSSSTNAVFVWLNLENWIYYSEIAGIVTITTLMLVILNYDFRWIKFHVKGID